MRCFIFCVNPVHSVDREVICVVRLGNGYPVQVWTHKITWLGFDCFARHCFISTNKMTCACKQCRAVRKGTKKRIPCVSPGILYLLSKTTAPKKRISFSAARKKVRRKKKGGKFIRNKKVTKVPRRRVKIIGQKRKLR